LITYHVHISLDHDEQISRGYHDGSALLSNIV